MAKLTGIGVYKLLPKTNCGDCNVPTCMAFAMQVAAKKVALEDCPHVSEDAKQELAESAAPPMRVVTIGTGDGAVEIGGETVLFRHEEKFHRAAALAIRIQDTQDVAAEVDATRRGLDPDQRAELGRDGGNRSVHQRLVAHLHRRRERTGRLSRIYQ